jgi:hypothetical protein
MASISDSDRDAFSKAEKTVADNFTAEELREINQMAARLRQILKASIDRHQESFKRWFSMIPEWRHDDRDGDAADVCSGD